METVKIGICEPESFSEKAIGILKSIGSIEFFNGKDIKGFIKDKYAIFVRLKYKIDDDLISNADNLKFICSPTTGLNHIDVSKDDITVLSLKGEYEFLNTVRATPEHIFGLSLALLRNYAHAFRTPDNFDFNRIPYRGYELYHNSIGIVGMGRIGKIISDYYTAFGADVYYYDKENIILEDYYRCASMEELIDKSKIIILCSNYTKDNENMINANHFKRMKGKYFINAARGELVRELDLLEYIKKDWFAGVAIDVIANETSESDFYKQIIQLTHRTNLIITPHIGGATFTSMMRTEEFIAGKLVNAVKGK